MAENNQTPIENEEDFMIVSLVDEDGNEKNFEIIDEVEYKDNLYRAVVPYLENEEEYLNADLEMVIMKVMEDGDEIYMDVVEDDAEWDAVAALFEERLSDEMDIIE